MTMLGDGRERRIQEEMEHHLEALAQRLEAEGMAPAEARREALRRFGDPTKVARATRASGAGWAGRIGDGLRGELTQVVRGLRRAPAFTASVVVTLGLALGATLAVLGVVWDVILRPLDLAEPESLVALVERMPETGVEDSPVSEGTFQDWRRELRSVSGVVAYEWTSETLEDPERPEQLLTVEVTGDFFDVLGIPPLLGRAFTSADEPAGGPANVVVLSHDFWTRRFGGDPQIVGRQLPIEGGTHTVVGVLPERLDLFPQAPDAFLPSSHTPAEPTNRGYRILNVVARLERGRTAADASAEVASFAERISELHPASARGWSAEAIPLREHLLGDAERPLGAVTAGVALLLLIAAVNVSNLFGVRSAHRLREMAVRAVVGAGRGGLVRLGLLEAAVLCFAAAFVGVALAGAIRLWLFGSGSPMLPRAVDVGPSWPLVGGALILATLLTLSLGTRGATRAADAAAATLGRGTGVGVAIGRGRSALLVAQLALTAVLLVGAGLLVRTVTELRQVDPGYDPGGAVAARILLDPRRYGDGADERAYFAELLERVRAVPGVRAAGVTSALPMDPASMSTSFDLPTLSDEAEGLGWDAAPQVDFRIIGPGLMEALGFRVVRGRTLDGSERPDGPLVAVVNESLAELFWPGADPIGRRLQSIWREGQWFEVVGVVQDTRFYGPRRASRPELYVPHEQMAWGDMTVVVRAEGEEAAVQAALERAVLDTDPLLPPLESFPVRRLLAATRASERFYALLLGGFALLGLTLAAAGVYGVFAYSVRQRKREIGVRLALGAGRGAVLGRIVGSGLLLAAAGIVTGIAAALPAGRLLSGVLFGVRPTDVPTLAGVALLLLVVAAAASLGPALRAAFTDPARVLRED